MKKRSSHGSRYPLPPHRPCGPGAGTRSPGEVCPAARVNTVLTFPTPPAQVRQAPNTTETYQCIDDDLDQTSPTRYEPQGRPYSTHGPCFSKSLAALPYRSLRVSDSTHRSRPVHSSHHHPTNPFGPLTHCRSSDKQPGLGREPALPFPMEADLETLSPVGAFGSGPEHKHASSVSSLSASTAVPSPTSSELRQRSSSDPDNGAVKRIVDHDSLVTVRLSEPPTRQLTLNTNVSTHGTIQSRRSLFANTLSPGSISQSPLSSSFDPNEDLSPVTPSSALRSNLQDELEGVDDDTKTISGVEPEDSDDEEVDWDQLQKTEDAESKHNDEDVGFSSGGFLRMLKTP